VTAKGADKGGEEKTTKGKGSGCPTTSALPSLQALVSPLSSLTLEAKIGGRAAGSR